MLLLSALPVIPCVDKALQYRKSIEQIGVAGRSCYTGYQEGSVCWDRVVVQPGRGLKPDESGGPSRAVRKEVIDSSDESIVRMRQRQWTGTCRLVFVGVEGVNELEECPGVSGLVRSGKRESN